jgi:hypothetical protein
MRLPDFRADRFAQLTAGIWFWAMMGRSESKLVFGARLEIAPDKASQPAVPAVVLVNTSDGPAYVPHPDFRLDTLAFGGELRLELGYAAPLWGNDANGEVPSPGGLCRGAAEQPADGLLCAGADRPRCPRAWRPGLIHRREPQRMGLLP